MPTTKKASTADQVKKGYNEKNPVQPQGPFEPDAMKQNGQSGPTTNAKKVHEKETSNK